MAKVSNKLPITAAFGAIFRRIRKREPFASPEIIELGDKMFEAIVAAALAKCVEFNIAANRARKHADEEFVFVSTLRGICEDLICLAYYSRMSLGDRRKITRLLINQTVADGLQVQSAFFKSNNPFQPVLGSDDTAPREVARDAIKAFWKSFGVGRKSGPTVKEMAAEVGLTFTYDYIYFASSNFVHFNPQALLRTGWGDPPKPFKFSVSHFSGYYKSLASFYGAILFLGYHSAFSSSQFYTNCEHEVSALLELIESQHRWPEVITFEEMNKSPPLYLLTHAMRGAFPEPGAPKGILSEVQGLGARLAVTPQ